MSDEPDAIDQAIAARNAATATTPHGAPASGAPPPAAPAPDAIDLAAQARADAESAKTPPLPKKPAGAAPDPNAPELSLSDTATQAKQNFVDSWKNMWGKEVTGLGDMIGHPINTAQNLWTVEKGIYSKLGIGHDPAAESVVDTLGSEVKDAVQPYWQAIQGNTKALKQKIASDPASVMMDASIPLTLGAGAATKLPLVGKALSVAATATDPLASTIGLARGAGSLGMGAARQVQHAASGVPTDLLKTASDIAANGTAAQKGAFRTFLTGNGDNQDLVNAAKGAVNSFKQDQLNEYLNSKGNLASGQVDLAPIYQDLRKQMAANNMGASAGFGNAKSAVADIQGFLADAAQNPAKRTLPEMDALKQQIWDLKDTYHGLDRSDNVIDAMYNSVKNGISDVDPKYSDMMESWKGAAQHINDIQRTLLGTDKTAVTNSVIKMMRATKNNTVAGAGADLIEQLNEKNPLIKPMLAGLAMKERFPGGLRDFSSLAHVGAAAGAGMLGLGPIGGAFGAGAYLGAASPRFGARSNQFAGVMDKLSGIAQPLGQMGYRAGNQQSATPATGSTLPERLHNPGAMKSSPWSQQQPGYLGNEGGFAKFDSMEHGHAAAVQLVKNKLASPETNTPYGLINHPTKGWAPDQNGPGRSNTIASQTHVGLHDQFPPGTDPEALATLIERGEYPHAAGGRVGRALGGKVSIDTLVERLIAKWKKAKKQTDKSTEPLLKTPDAAIAKALAIAERTL